MTIKRLLAVDPGTNSFAYSVQEVGESPVFLQRGFIHSTIRTLTSSTQLETERLAFIESVSTLLKQYAVDAILAERYMLRRGQGGTAIECINIMLGVLMQSGLPLKIIPASQWKNAVNRSIQLEDCYLRNKGRLTPHEIDASYIGVWGCNMLSAKPQIFVDHTAELQATLSVNLGEKYKPPKKLKKRKRR